MLMAPRHNLKHSKINDYFLTQERELTDDEQQYHIYLTHTIMNAIIA